jgi:hypothetical protein
MNNFKCAECSSSKFRNREDNLRFCASCGWLELTAEQIAQEARWRQEYEAQRYLRD